MQCLQGPQLSKSRVLMCNIFYLCTFLYSVFIDTAHSGHPMLDPRMRLTIKPLIRYNLCPLPGRCTCRAFVLGRVPPNCALWFCEWHTPDVHTWDLDKSNTERCLERKARRYSPRWSFSKKRSCFRTHHTCDAVSNWATCTEAAQLAEPTPTVHIHIKPKLERHINLVNSVLHALWRSRCL